MEYLYVGALNFSVIGRKGYFSQKSPNFYRIVKRLGVSRDF